MHKQFQKFGLFVTKNSNEEAKTKVTDKNIKYLYKKETVSPDKTNKPKIKSVNEPNAASPKYSRKNPQEDKHPSHRKKSRESLKKRHRRREPLINNFASETEIFFISPEEIKRHRNKLRQPKEKSTKLPENIKKGRNSSHDDPERKKKKEDDVAQLIKQYNNKASESNYGSLTKKDIFKIINNIKGETSKTSPSASLLKKLFAFDKQNSPTEKPEQASVNDKHSKKAHHCVQDKNIIFVPQKSHADNAHKTTERKHKEPEKKSRECSVDIMYSRDSKKQREKSKSRERHNVQKRHTKVNMDAPKSAKKKRSRSVDAKLIFEELKISKNKDLEKPKSKKLQEMNVETSIDSVFEDKVQAKNKPIDGGNVEVKTIVKNINRTNPLRHKKCLVKNTFSVIEISPTTIQDDLLERKKKLKTFKNYYKYDHTADKDSEIAVNSTLHTFSDSHKMYQDQSTANISKEGRRKKKHTSALKSNLTLETHISTVNLEPQIILITKSLNTAGEEKRNRTQKSRIPVPSNNKIVELAKDPVSSLNSHKRSADLFSPHVWKGKDAENIEELERAHIMNVLRTEVAKEKLSSSKPSSARSSIVEKPCSTKSTRPQSVPSKIKENNLCKANDKKCYANTELKIASKVSPEKKFESKKRSPETSNKNIISTLPTNRRLISGVRKGVKSPSRVSCEGSSSVWSKGSRSNKTSFTSKSETRLSRNKPERKYKPIERSSANSSISNSTFDSTKNTSFLLTKSYKDDEKLSRWQKRKLYSDKVRQNVISKSQKSSIIPPQLLEVRYLTIANEENVRPHIREISSNEMKPSEMGNVADTSKNFFDNDLPNPCLELIEDYKFKELFELPTDQALNEILNENYNFLMKDFSATIEDFSKFSTSSDDPSTDDLLNDKQTNDWYNFQMVNDRSLSEISCCRRNSDAVTNEDLNIESQDHIVDSLSAPCSEESGYASTLKSREFSRGFFEKPDIKALFNPHFDMPSDSCYVEVQIEASSSSGMEIRSIESKSMQTSCIDCSQKSVQIKMSREKIVEFNFNNKKSEMDKKKKENFICDGENSLVVESYKVCTEELFDRRNKDEIINANKKELKTKKIVIEEEDTMEEENNNIAKLFHEDANGNVTKKSSKHSKENKDEIVKDVSEKELKTSLIEKKVNVTEEGNTNVSKNEDPKLPHRDINDNIVKKSSDLFKNTEPVPKTKADNENKTEKKLRGKLSSLNLIHPKNVDKSDNRDLLKKEDPQIFSKGVGYTVNNIKQKSSEHFQVPVASNETDIGQKRKNMKKKFKHKLTCLHCFSRDSSHKSKNSVVLENHNAQLLKEDFNIREKRVTEMSSEDCRNCTLDKKYSAKSKYQKFKHGLSALFCIRGDPSKNFLKIKFEINK